MAHDAGATVFVPPVGSPPTRKRINPAIVIEAPTTSQRPYRWAVSHTPIGRAKTKLEITMAWTTTSDPIDRAAICSANPAADSRPPSNHTGWRKR